MTNKQSSVFDEFDRNNDKVMKQLAEDRMRKEREANARANREQQDLQMQLDNERRAREKALAD